MDNRASREKGKPKSFAARGEMQKWQFKARRGLVEPFWILFSAKIHFCRCPAPPAAVQKGTARTEWDCHSVPARKYKNSFYLPPSVYQSMERYVRSRSAAASGGAEHPRAAERRRSQRTLEFTSVWGKVKTLPSAARGTEWQSYCVRAVPFQSVPKPLDIDKNGK